MMNGTVRPLPYTTMNKYCFHVQKVHGTIARKTIRSKIM